MSALRAAGKYGQRPTAMILHDPYALHRKWWDWDWEPGENDKDWTDWDFILAHVYETIQDYTNQSTGVFLPFDQSGDVHFDVLSQFSGSEAALEKARNDRKLRDGESLYAVPVFDPNKPKPTLETWARDLEEGKADGRDTEHRDSRPPTPEELARLRELKATGKLE